jgi:DNA-binding PadR family transcriptional regulator
LTQTPRTLVVLALLCERDMHPYEIQQVVRERCLNSVVKLTQGALYHAVDRLVEHELIQPVETSREGRRPERTVYSITEAGRDAVTLYLRELIATPSSDGLVTATALAVASLLPPDVVAKELERRLVALAGFVAAYRAIIERLLADGLDRYQVIEIEYAVAMHEAELSFVRALRDDLSKGRITWRARCPRLGSVSADGELRADLDRQRDHVAGDTTGGVADAPHVVNMKIENKGNAG